MALGHIHPSIKSVPGLFGDGKVAGEWSYTLIPPYAFMAQLLIIQRDKVVPVLN
jgi:hypothetical protein